jgi:hypothetical protein
VRTLPCGMTCLERRARARGATRRTRRGTFEVVSNVHLLCFVGFKFASSKTEENCFFLIVRDIFCCAMGSVGGTMSSGVYGRISSVRSWIDDNVRTYSANDVDVNWERV